MLGLTIGDVIGGAYVFALVVLFAAAVLNDRNRRPLCRSPKAVGRHSPNGNHPTQALKVVR